MDDDLKRRLAENQALYRSLNERIKDVGVDLGGSDHPYEFVCECADLTCNTRITATLEEYDAVRERPDRFLLLEGHAVPELESVVGRTRRFVVVEKTGVAREAVTSKP